MSFLAPLFLLGGLAVAAPIILHFIRRSTRERVPFSSLMFLLPTPPRLTRKSRLENIFLLLLRCLVLCLLAAAFARPYWRKPVNAMPQAGAGKRTVVLVDTSASMRRAGVWEETAKRAGDLIRKAGPGDEVCLAAFDRGFHLRLSFEQWRTAPVSDRTALALTQLAALSPGWAATQLGTALTAAADLLEENLRPDQPALDRQIVVFSDFQEGARLDGLQGREWSRGMEVVLDQVKAKSAANAGIQWLADRDEVEQLNTNETVRVRVANAADSRKEQFRLGWARAGETGMTGEKVEVYVPPGQVRVALAPKLPAGLPGEFLRLEGDDDDFDNGIHRVASGIEQLKVLYLGSDDEKDSTRALYYLKRAFQATRRRAVQVVSRNEKEQLTAGDFAGVGLIIVADSLPEARLELARAQWQAGKTVLFTVSSPAAIPTLGKLLRAESLSGVEAPADRYAMLGQIDFTHPLFAPFADPRFSDFTKIHFWKHRRLDTNQLANARILARFDNGDPALLQATAGQGLAFILTSGWQPSDSQLALSSKFVPLLYAMLETGGAIKEQTRSYQIGDEVNLPGGTDAPATVRKPDGVEVKVEAGRRFTATDLPGIYTVTSAPPPARFAVNLAAEESRTAPLALEEFERLGVPLKQSRQSLTPAAEKKREEHLQAAELENRQKLWRWLIVGAIAVLLFETWLAGWLTRRAAPVEAQA